MQYDKEIDDTGRMSVDADDGVSLGRRTSALEEVPTLVPPPGFPGIVPSARRRSNASRVSFQLELPELHRNDRGLDPKYAADVELHDMVHDLPVNLSLPRAAKTGLPSTIREVPSNLPTPSSTRPPSPRWSGWPGSGPITPSEGCHSTAPLDAALPHSPASYELGFGQAYPDVGVIRSWRGALILLCTCGAQLMDNVFMTGVNISLPAIQAEFGIAGADLQWLISAYTLSFGGFLLLSGVLADRYGRRRVFTAGMVLLSVWSLAVGFAPSFIMMAVFRALQGVGAAMTVPSAVGIISNYFTARDRTLALTVFGAAGAVGFCLGLVFGGFLTSSLGWRYVFFVAVAITGTLGLLGWFALPKDRRLGDGPRPRLDFAGAGLSTTGLILLSFVLSSGGEYGWGKAFIIVLLVLSVALIGLFAWVEKKVPDPVMPLSLWKLENFAALWIGGFVMYGGWQTCVYYVTLTAQDVNQLSAAQTALRFLPMGVVGFITSLAMSRALEKWNTKMLLVAGMLISAVAPIPSALMLMRDGGDTNFWRHVFPTTLIAVVGVTIVYCTITVVLLASVPVSVQSLCGGMINTAFQVGSGVGLALASAVVQAVDVNKGHSVVRQYGTGLWCCVGLAGIGFVLSTFGVKDKGRGWIGGPVMVH